MKRLALLLDRFRQWMLFDIPWRATGPSPITEWNRKEAHRVLRDLKVTIAMRKRLALLLLVSLICSALPGRAQIISI